MTVNQLYILVECDFYDRAASSIVTLKASNLNLDEYPGYIQNLSIQQTLNEPYYGGNFGALLEGITISNPVVDFRRLGNYVKRHYDWIFSWHNFGESYDEQRFTYRHRPCRVYHGPTNRKSAMTLVTLSMQNIEAQNGELNIFLTHPTTDIPILNTRFLGTGGASPEPEGPTELKDKRKPTVFGIARRVKPQIVDDAIELYQVCARNFNAITAAYDDTAALTPITEYEGLLTDFIKLAYTPVSKVEYHKASGMVRMKTVPQGVLTFDVEGETFVDTHTLDTSLRSAVGSDSSGNDDFSYSVAACDSRVFVGCPLANTTSGGADSGEGYVFTYDSVTDAWVEEYQFEPTASASNELGGYSTACMDIGTIWVAFGAPSSGSSGQNGKVWMYERVSGTWTARSSVTASSGQADSLFGFAVAMSNDWLAVGAPRYGSPEVGAVFMFSRSGTTWTQQQQIDGAATGDRFGEAVSLSGDWLAVGAPSVGTDKGRVYVYENIAGTWTAHDDDQPASLSDNDEFGSSVAIDGTELLLLVGAPFQTNGVNSAAGAVYAYSIGASTITEDQKVTQASPAANDNFGYSVSISGLTAGVGAPEKGTTGTAYRMTYAASTWTIQQTFTAGTTTPKARLGHSVSAREPIICYGAQNDNTTGKIHVMEYPNTTVFPKTPANIAKYLIQNRVNDASITVNAADVTALNTSNGWDCGFPLKTDDQATVQGMLTKLLDPLHIIWGTGFGGEFRMTLLDDDLTGTALHKFGIEGSPIEVLSEHLIRIEEPIKVVETIYHPNNNPIDDPSDGGTYKDDSVGVTNEFRNRTNDDSGVSTTDHLQHNNTRIETLLDVEANALSNAQHRQNIIKSMPLVLSLECVNVTTFSLAAGDLIEYQGRFSRVTRKGRLLGVYHDGGSSGRATVTIRI